MTTICSSGKTPFLSFVIVKEEDENKYVAEIKEMKQDAQKRRFDDYYKAKEWITDKVNDIYRDFDEIS